jgi:hypothetical protein
LGGFSRRDEYKSVQSMGSLRVIFVVVFFPLVRKKTIGVHVEAGRQPPGSKVVGYMISVL